MRVLAAAPFAAAGAAPPRARPSTIQSRLGGGSGQGGGSGGQRLIIPGQQDAGSRRPGGGLIVPGGGTAPAPGRPGGGGQLEGAGPVQQNFRPPPGFMNSVGKPAAEDVNMSKDEMLDRLRSEVGHWHELAKLLPALQREGLDGMAVAEITGLERKTQNVWASASQVYESIKASGELSKAALEHFDNQGEDLLYELRLLGVKQRIPAAAYIAERNFSPQDAQLLAKCLKEHERRDGNKEGFTNSPGDALAYKFFRDAQECRKKEAIEACIKRGLAVVETDKARAKLNELLGAQEDAEIAALPTATLAVLRLTRDELGSRVVAVAGSLQTATAAEVRAASKVSSEGVFGNFRIPAAGASQEWVALPNWSVLNLAGHPVALTIRNCADVEQIVISSSAKTETEMKRLIGEALVLADLSSDVAAVREDKYYLVSTPSGGVKLADGTAAAELDPAMLLGPVLFLCRPPNRGDSPTATTSEVMSV